MNHRPFGPVVKSAVIAGVLVGLLVALFHFSLTEPVIDRAIALEEALHEGGEHGFGTPVVSREGQQVGLFLGFLIYGLIWPLLTSVVYHLVEGKRGIRNGVRRAVLVALLAGWSVALFPFLKYPANPPGVGDPETIHERQLLYVIFIALSIAVTLLAVIVHHRLRSRKLGAGRGWRKRLIVGAVYLVGAGALFVAMPANFDASAMPGDLVMSFQVLSFAGLSLFWVLFAGSFGWLISRYRGTIAHLH